MRSLLEDKRLLWFISFGLIIRLLLAGVPGFNIDINDWFAWAIRLDHFNFSQFYSKDIFTDYTPGYLYVLSLLGFLKNLLRIPDVYFYTILKLPAIISELILGLLVYWQVKKYFPLKYSLLILALIFFNPAVIFNSSVWGQIDSILTLFMLVAVIFLKQKKLALSSLFLGFALLIKPQAIALIPLYAIFLARHFTNGNLIRITAPSFIIIFFLTAPFFPDQTIINLGKHILTTASQYSYTSLNAYNFWGAIGFWIKDNTIWNNLSYQVWGYILLAVYWILITYFYFRKNVSVLEVAALAALGFFFLPTRVHERYLYPGIVFLILTASHLKSRLLIILTGILSLLHFFNLYYVYVYYNAIYLKLPVLLYNPLIYNFLADNGKNLSLISTFIFILISIILFKDDVIPEKTRH